ncbi:LEAF RUST 10 DISEASE-RESISTANCE LOCUS RECEPTOR-LIKE PROTEIN KINASE-like 2.4 [Silene latifolia]|uniref:LEAF RUST 10 DISEASE-RESISTANCE LOCUS RECEPTOR-LIKE PROTEIN KINASE-like 2.4 n=1 Tax=Silene latifolia TaxID=37657 RepID=UPI003D78160A
MASTLFTFQYNFIVLIFLVTMIHLSTGNNAYYAICKNNPFSCGNITNVGYPFWGGNRPQFCGHRNIGLNCRQTGPTVGPFIYDMGNTNGAESLSTRVVSINTFSHTMSLVQKPFSNETDISCQNLIRNETIFTLSHPFKLTPTVVNISLFFGCDSSVSNYSGSLKVLTCNGVNNTADSAYYVDKPEDVANISKLCSTRFFPVLKSELDDLNKGNVNLTRVLNKGFEVEYTVDFDACSACQNSGGQCGSSDDNKMRFTCYCPDGTYTAVCHKPGTPSQPLNSRRRKLVIIGSVSGALALMILVLVLVLLCICSKKGLLPEKVTSLKIRRIKQNQNVEAFLKAYGSLAPKRYRYADIKKIASSFKEKLGEGGFGIVYKGKLQDGRLVAVKLLNKMKGNGDDFINEVLSISRTNHVNVVGLLGFCLEGNKRALIYEYLVNGSLDKFICGRTSTHPSLQWETMFKIAVGIARGLNYLHRGCNARILHFDIKPHNVLLDEEFCPKISDFGLAKLCPTKDSTISMLEARGTIGYIAPEVVYRTIGGVSHKSDVYSYGMMVLNMACGGSNLSPEVQRSSEQYFPEWIFKRLEQTEQTTHAMLNEEEKVVQRKMILVSLWCIQTYPSDRPSMDRVLEMIEGPLESLPMPPRAATVYI